jgi:hypothetical protein
MVVGMFGILWLSIDAHNFTTESIDLHCQSEIVFQGQTLTIKLN